MGSMMILSWKRWSCPGRLVSRAWFCPVILQWKHGKETWVVQGIGETLVIGRDRQKRRSRTFTQLPQAEKYLARMGFKAAP